MAVTATFEYQRLLARLVVDDSFHTAFLRDRTHVADTMGLDPDLVGRIDLAGVDTFRTVVRGSRSTTFRLVLGRLADVLTIDEWRRLLSDFHRQVVVADASGWHDLDLFCDWLDDEFPGSKGATVARYQTLVQQLGSARHVDVPAGSLRANPKAGWFATPYDFEDVMDMSPADVWAFAPASELHYYALVATTADDDITVLEIDRRGADVLTLLQRPRSASEVAARIAGDTGAPDQLIDDLADAGLIVYGAEAHG